MRQYDVGNVTGTQRFTSFAYDHEGRQTFAAYPVASLSSVSELTEGVRTSYDPLGRVVRVRENSELGELQTTTEYIAGGKTRVTDPRSQSTTTSFLAYDEPEYSQPLRIDLPEAVVVDISRDVFGKPRTITRRNADGSTSISRSYVYDPYQRLCKTIEPEVGATVQEYDGADNIVWTASGLQGFGDTGSCNRAEAAASGRVTVRIYDARDRVSSLSFPDGSGNQRIAYWPDGLVRQVTTTNSDGKATYNSYTYNNRRLLIGESVGHSDSETWSLMYGYNPNGHLTSTRFPSGQTVTYEPNALGQATRAGAYATGARYDARGALAGYVLGNGIERSISRYPRGSLERIRDAYGSLSVVDESYDYDFNGNLAGITDGLGGRSNRDMTYDGLDRLKSVSSPLFGTFSYGYDALDNITRVQAPGRDHAYCYDWNWRLTNIKAANCSGSTIIGLGYDLQGNLSNKNGQPYVFDFGNRLRDVTGKESYRYDGQGRRTKAAAGSGAIYSVYDQGGALRYQKNERTRKGTDYVTLAGTPVAEVDWPSSQAVPAKDRVSWISMPGATTYMVEESVDGVTWTTVYEGSGLTWESMGRPKATYTYRMLACTGQGVCTPLSNFAHVQRPAINIVPLLYQLLLN